MPYTTVERVQRMVGADLTADQAAEAHALLAAADRWIDARAGRTWSGGSTPVVGELHTLAGHSLYLDRAPIASVASVEVRPPSPGAAWGTWGLAAYEVVDPARGLVLLPWGYAGWWARVSYTPAQVVDPTVALAATKLVAHWLVPLLSASAGGAATTGVVKRYSLGQELSVDYDTAASAATAAAAVSELGVPNDVVGLVDSLREVAIA